jgi:hypothetical protein
MASLIDSSLIGLGFLADIVLIIISSLTVTLCIGCCATPASNLAFFLGFSFGFFKLVFLILAGILKIAKKEIPFIERLPKDIAFLSIVTVLVLILYHSATLLIPRILV